MKILLANKFYYRRGGDCIYTMNVEEMLRERGHEVAMYAMNHPENEASEWSRYWPANMTRLDAFTRPFGARQVIKGFTQLMDDFRPDVVHLNNIHTQLSPVIARIAHERGARVVWTLHDTKLVCPCHTCTRDGVWCTECFVDKRAVIKHLCMPGSLPGAVIGYLEAMRWNKDVLHECVDLFLPPSKFMMDVCVAGGYSPEKFRVLCNFIDVKKVANPCFEKGEHFVYVGRVSKVKGIRTLCQAAVETGRKLVVIGGGELLDELQTLYGSHKNIEFKGQMPWKDFRPILERARFMVLPSECSENNPLTIIEAQSLGTPVLGARIGGIPELIEENVNGMTFKSGDMKDLKDKIQKMYEHLFDYEEIAKNAVGKYSSETYYEKLMRYYKG